MEYKEIRERIVKAGEKAVKELIKVAEGKIITDDEGDLTADKLKNAAAAKKLAIFDAFEIMSRIEAEQNTLEENPVIKDNSIKGFAEKRATGGKR
jgi:DNA-binding ferritin-like protein